MNLRTLFAVIFALTVCSRCPAFAEGPSPDQAAIQMAWEQFIEARVDGDGERAVSLVSQKTIDRMARVKQLALNGTAEEIKREPISIKTEIIDLRLTSTRNDLSQLTPERLCARYFGEPLKQTTPIQFKGFKIDGKSAVANTANGVQLKFSNEKGAWKIDWSAYIEFADRAARDRIKNLKQDENKFITDALSQVTGKKVGEEIWEAKNFK